MLEPAMRHSWPATLADLRSSIGRSRRLPPHTPIKYRRITDSSAGRSVDDKRHERAEHVTSRFDPRVERGCRFHGASMAWAMTCRTMSREENGNKPAVHVDQRVAFRRAWLLDMTRASSSVPVTERLALRVFTFHDRPVLGNRAAERTGARMRPRFSRGNRHVGS